MRAYSSSTSSREDCSSLYSTSSEAAKGLVDLLLFSDSVKPEHVSQVRGNSKERSFIPEVTGGVCAARNASWVV
jgi:hypothetical protein